MIFRHFLPAIIWSIVIVWLLTLPASSIPKTGLLNIPHLDKLVHIFLFAIFTFLLNYGFYKQEKKAIKANHYTITMVLGVVFSIATEWIQWQFVISRSGSVYDIVADLVGCTLGIIGFWGWKKYFPTFLIG